MAGAPGNDFGDSSIADYGRVFAFENATRESAWQTVAQQQPTVDTRLLNSVFLYDRVTCIVIEAFFISLKA